jgi:predicted O-methyltransferase YrrM
MLAFKRGTTERFDEHIPFGNGDKLELLFRLGHDRTPHSGHLTIEGDMTKLVGKTMHMPTGSDYSEQNVDQREDLRRTSLNWMCDRIARWPQMRFQVEKPLGRFWENVDGYFDYQGLYSSIAFDVHDGARIVEVGSWQGKSAIYLATQFKAFGKRAHIHCVDTFDGGTDQMLKTRIEAMGGSTELFKRFNNNIHNAQVAYMVTPHVRGSIEASNEFKDESLDVVFIDADHSYAAVKADLEAWYPKLKPGGLMAGHDFVFEDEASREGVIRACLEFFVDKPFEVMPGGRVWKSVAYKGGDPMFPDSVHPGRRRRLWA